MGRIAARPGLYVDDADFDDVAGLGAANENRTGQDVDAKTFAGAAAEQLAVDGARATTIDAFLVLGPKIDALKTGIALDHTLGVVTSVVCNRFDSDVIA